ncbi:baseplate J/gp47 family protein [Dryocola sp. LX212]
MADSDFYRPPLPDLITQLRNDILSRFQSDDILRRADAEVYSRAVAAAVNTLYGYIDYLARNILPDEANELWLYRHGNLKKCPRKPAVEAAGWARWDGVDDGVAIDEGVELQRDDQVTFITTAAAISAGGTLRVPVECETAGSTGNTDDGTALSLVSPVSGLSSRAAADSVVGGADIEGVEQWRARIIDRWYYVPQSGADEDYVIWAESVPGISRAWTFRNWAGLGTVGVMCATDDDTNPVPSDAELQAVYDYIAPLSPVAGSSLHVFGPALKIVDFRILVNPDTEEVRAAVESELKACLKRDGEPGGVVEISRMNEAISVAAGEFSHNLLSPAEDVQLADNELPVAGTFTWS